MSINFKKILLAGTALVAVAAFTTQAQALPRVMTAGGTWASSAVPNAATALIADAVTGDAVDITTGAATLLITSGGPTDGGGTNIFSLGAVTDSGAGVGAISITGNTTAGAESVTIASGVIDGNFTVAHADAQATTNQTIAITGGLTVGGAMSVTSVEATAAETQIMTVGGALAVTTTTALTAGALVAGGTTGALTVTGNTTFGGNVTVTGGAGHATANTYTLTLNGATNAFSGAGGLILADGGAGSDAILALSGATAQTVSGIIAGGAVGKINIANALGATFSGTVAGALITIENGGAALNSAATFQNTVASAITLGGAGTGTNTVTFDGTTAGFTATGAIAGAAAGETDNIAVTNTSGAARTITLATASVTNLDNLSVTGSTGTLLTTGQNLTVTASSIGAGATLATTGNTLTTNSTVTGTLRMGGGAVTGTTDGSSAGVGTLDMTVTGTHTGNIGGTTSLAAINVATGAVLTATAAVNATTTTLTGTGTVALGALAHAVTTNIVAAVTGDGAITIADGATTTAVTGNIGTSGSKVATLAIAGAAANLLTTTGNLYINAITANDADTIQFLGTSAAPQTVSGTITDGIVTVGNGVLTSDVTFSGALSSIASGGVTLAATGTFNANAGFTGVYTNLGTTQVNAGKTLTVGNLDEASVGTFNIVVDKTAAVQTFGKIAETGDVDVSNDTIHFVVTGAQPLTTGASVLDNVFGGTAQNTIAGATVTDNSFIYSFALVNDTNNVDVTVTAAAMADVGTTPGNVSVGDVLITDLAASANAQINTIQGNLAAAGTEAEANAVLEAVQPTVDGGAQTAALDVGFATQGISDTRMAAIRSGDGTSGMAAGSSGNGVTMWLQGYGQTANQDLRSGIAGYDANTLGGALGVDSANLMDHGTIGIAFNYGVTNADSDNVNSTDTDVDSYGVNLYANYDLGQEMFVNGQLGYARGNIDSTRHDVVAPGDFANGSTDSNLYSAKLALGRDYAQEYGMTVTPVISAAYNHLRTDGYTETGTAGGGLLTVGSDTNTSVKLGIGGTASWKMKNADGSVMKPAIHAGYTYAATDDRIDVTSSFTGDAGNTAFTSTGADPARHEFNAGVGMTYMTAADWDLSANYDYRYKADYSAHNGVLRASSHF